MRGVDNMFFSAIILDMTFEWDEIKNLANREKYHISFERAQEESFMIETALS
jgi:uncharacterized DUF497 family protein